ncbi:MAG: MFS transporter [Candidatus Poseidoniales archaeon]
MLRRFARFLDAAAWFSSWIWASLWMAELGYSTSFIFAMAIFHSLCLAIASLVSGRLVDLYQPKWIAVGGLLLAAVAIGMQASVTSVVGIGFTRLLGGIGHGATMPALVAWLRRDNQQVSGLAASGQLGWAVGALSAGAVIDLYSLELMFIAAAVLNVIALSLLCFQSQPAAAAPGSKARSPLKVYTDLKWYYIPFFARQSGAHTLWAVWGILLAGLAVGHDVLALNTVIGMVQAINGLVQFTVGMTIAKRWHPHRSIRIGYWVSVFTFLGFLTTRPIGDMFDIAPLYVMLIWQAPLGLGFGLLYIGTLRAVSESCDEPGTATGLIGVTLSSSAIFGPAIGLAFYSLSMANGWEWLLVDHRTSMLLAVFGSLIGALLFVKHWDGSADEAE